MTMTRHDDKEPRGWRNHNPLNIEYSPRNKWLGQRGQDGRFAIFERREYGYRAALKLLRTYTHRHGLSTLRQLITRWCPPTEEGNDTEAYIRTVAERSGLPTDEPLKLYSEATCVRLLEAMTYVECGRPGDEEAIRRAYKLLLNGW